MGENVARIDIDNPVDVLQSLLVCSYLGIYETAVVKGQGVAGLILKHFVEVGHGCVVVLELVIDQCAVEICERVVGLEFYGLVVVLYGEVEFPLRCEDPCPSDISFRIEPVQFDGLVVVVECLCRVPEVEIAGSAVQVCIALARLLADEHIEVLDGLVELLREEIGHSPAEIEVIVAWTQVHSLLEVLNRKVVLADAAESDGPVVVCGGVDRVEMDGAVEVALGSCEVAEVVFRNTSEEVCLIDGAVQLGEDVEALDGLGVLAVVQRLPAAPHEDVGVILGA